jgi:hypothetical protein
VRSIEGDRLQVAFKPNAAATTSVTSFVERLHARRLAA